MCGKRNYSTYLIFIWILLRENFTMKCSTIISLLVLASAILTVFLVQETNGISVTVMKNRMRIRKIRKIQTLPRNDASNKSKKGRRASLKSIYKKNNKPMHVPGRSGKLNTNNNLHIIFVLQRHKKNLYHKFQSLSCFLRVSRNVSCICYTCALMGAENTWTGNW